MCACSSTYFFRPDVFTVRRFYWAKGLARERASGPRAPSLALLPPGALVFAVPANLVPHEAAKDPLKAHMRVRRTRKRAWIRCATL